MEILRTFPLLEVGSTINHNGDKYLVVEKIKNGFEAKKSFEVFGKTKDGVFGLRKN